MRLRERQQLDLCGDGMRTIPPPQLNGYLTYYCPKPRMERGLSVGMALAGGVIVTGTLNLLRSTMESRVVVRLGGTVTPAVAVAEAFRPLKSAFRLNLSSTRWR